MLSDVESISIKIMNNRLQCSWYWINIFLGSINLTTKSSFCAWFGNIKSCSWELLSKTRFKVKWKLWKFFSWNRGSIRMSFKDSCHVWSEFKDTNFTKIEMTRTSYSNLLNIIIKDSFNLTISLSLITKNEIPCKFLSIRPFHSFLQKNKSIMTLISRNLIDMLMRICIMDQ